MSQHQSPIREELVSSAVDFLLDKSIGDSPLAKKIEFLESKGLSESEVQEALARAQRGVNQPSVAVSSSTPSSSSTTTTSTTAPVNNAIPPQAPIPDYYYNAPPLPERDWKDYFVMATATAGLSYGIYQIVKRYVVPKILPPSKTQLEKDKESIDQEFMRVESLLEKFEQDQKEFYESQETKSKKIDDTLVDIAEIINKTNEKNLSNEETLKYLKLEIENIKTTLMKSLDAQKSTLNSELTSIEKQVQEIRFDFQNKSKMTTSASMPVGISQQAEKSSLLHTPPNESSERSSPISEANLSAINMGIPPASSVPSIKDILGKEKSKDIESSSISAFAKKNENEKELEKSIPAWQLAATSGGGSSTEGSVNGDDKPRGIPAWQLNA
uniref:Peroxisomal membrane protein PEX14 n=1 Tax=Ogataea methanolica TaxID=1156966 RepID=F7IYB8_OGAME|nr:peroxisomal membrane protein Pex14p [Ogataea methanolica]